LRDLDNSQTNFSLGRRRESNTNAPGCGTSVSRRLASQAERDAEETNRIHREMMEILNANPLAKRKFLQQASTSSAVQVIWSHPDELHGPEKKGLTYELQYGVGAKVNKQE
jgi:hypothetical protein